MGWWGEPSTDKAATFNLMQALDVRKAVVEFSGGNDEGGIDGITVYRGERMIEGDLPYSYDEGGTKEEQLSHLLGRPVYDQYDSFAGEFYVDGVVTWDLNERTVKMTGDERVDSYEGFSKDL